MTLTVRGVLGRAETLSIGTYPGSMSPPATRGHGQPQTCLVLPGSQLTSPCQAAYPVHKKASSL